MAKRFTDTDKWKRPWFRKLTPDQKLAWVYLIDNCDHAGIWPADFELMSFQLGADFGAHEIERVFWDKIQKVAEDKYFIPSFVEFQYGELNPDNRAHLSVLNLLEKVGASKGLADPIQGAKDKDKDKDKDLDKEKENPRARKKREHSPLPKLALIWNAHCGNLPQVQGCSNERTRKAAQRWQEKPDEAYWVGIVQRLAASSFCNGNSDRGWKADFDFLIRPETHHKAQEGKYDDRVGGRVERVDPAILRLREQVERELSEGRDS